MQAQRSRAMGRFSKAGIGNGIPSRVTDEQPREGTRRQQAVHIEIASHALTESKPHISKSALAYLECDNIGMATSGPSESLERAASCGAAPLGERHRRKEHRIIGSAVDQEM